MLDKDTVLKEREEEGVEKINFVEGIWQMLKCKSQNANIKFQILKLCTLASFIPAGVN